MKTTIDYMEFAKEQLQAMNCTVKDGDDLIIEQAIVEIAKRADVQIDRLDLGCTLMHAMSTEQKNDLVAMMGVLVGSGMDAADVLTELYHDLNAFKQLYLNPHYAGSKLKGFSARSAGLAAKAKRASL